MTNHNDTNEAVGTRWTPGEGEHDYYVLMLGDDERTFDGDDWADAHYTAHVTGAQVLHVIVDDRDDPGLVLRTRRGTVDNLRVTWEVVQAGLFSRA